MGTKRKKKKALLSTSKNLLSILLSAGLFVATALIVYFVAIRGFEYGGKMAEEILAESGYVEVEVTIPKGASLDSVTDILKEKKLISNSLMFKIENLIFGSTDPFPGGTYQLNSDMDNSNLISILRNYRVVGKEIVITIKEYYTTKDIGKCLEDNKVIGSEDFISACTTEGFGYDFLDGLPQRDYPLEGYLFPDTYFVTQNARPKDIIAKLLSNFDDKFTYEYRDRANELGFTMDQIMIIASIIEKELRVDAQREMISEVIHNRLKSGMQLQMPSTVLYTLKERKTEPSEADLLVNSPYNTFINTGLPLGPICNPSAASIRAALYPSENGYIYMTLKSDKSGQYFFTDKLDEYVAEKEKYTQGD